MKRSSPAINFGRAFRVVRAAKGSNQKDMAKQIGVTASYLSLVERGERTPSAKVITRMSRSNSLTVVQVTMLAELDLKEIMVRIH